MRKYPAQTFRRSEVIPDSGRIFGGGIPITNRCKWNSNGTDSATTLTASHAYYEDNTNGKGAWRSRHPLPFDCTGVRVVLANTGQDPGASAGVGAEVPPWANSDLGTAVPVKVALEFPFGGTSKVIPVFFGGRRNPTIDEGGFIVSDPVSLDFLKSSQSFLYVRTYHNAGTGFYIPLHQEMNGADGEGYVTNSDLTDPGAGAGFVVSASNMFCPIMLLGTAYPRNQVVLGCVGDSILSGAKNTLKDGSTQGRATAGATNDRSFIDFANGDASPTWPLVKACKGSLTAQNEAQGGNGNNNVYLSVRRGMLAYCTHVFVMLGTNDINNGRTAGQLETDITTICNYLKRLGSKVILCTLPPRTTSSDNWATAANQTVTANEGVRTTYNAWVRNTALTLQSNYGGLPLVDYVYDVCSTIEVNSSNVLTQNGGCWLTTGVAQHASPDGVHPSWDGNQTYIGTDPALTGLIASLQV
jgi:hypothetical protein